MDNYDMDPYKETPIETSIEKPKRRPLRNSNSNATSWVRYAEVGVLALVVISNAYFGYSLKSVQAVGVGTVGTTVVSAPVTSAASTTTAVPTTTTTASTTTADQLQPAAIPEMVGGC